MLLSLGQNKNSYPEINALMSDYNERKKSEEWRFHLLQDLSFETNYSRQEYELFGHKNWKSWRFRPFFKRGAYLGAKVGVQDNLLGIGISKQFESFLVGVKTDYSFDTSLISHALTFARTGQGNFYAHTGLAWKRSDPKEINRVMTFAESLELSQYLSSQTGRIEWEGWGEVEKIKGNSKLQSEGTAKLYYRYREQWMPGGGFSYRKQSKVFKDIISDRVAPFGMIKYRGSVFMAEARIGINISDESQAFYELDFKTNELKLFGRKMSAEITGAVEREYRRVSSVLNFRI